MKNFYKRASAREGFTLVELIVVIAILGILAGIAIPVYSGYISKANEAADMQLLDSVKTAAAFRATELAIPGYAEIDTLTFNFGDTTVTATYKTGSATITESPLDISAYVTDTASKGGNASATWRSSDSKWTLTKAS